MFKATGLRYSNAEWNSGLRRIASWLRRGTHISVAAIVVVIDRFHQNIIEFAHIAREMMCESETGTLNLRQLIQ